MLSYMSEAQVECHRKQSVDVDDSFCVLCYSGEQEQEEDRLLSYMSEAQVECHRKQSVDVDDSFCVCLIQVNRNRRRTACCRTCQRRR